MQPKFHIEYQDIELARKQFDSFNQKHQAALEPESFKQFVHQQFSEALQLFSLHIKMPDWGYYVQLISVPAPNQIGGTALFEIKKRTKETHVFGYIIEFAIHDYYDHIHGNADQLTRKNIWVHELVHSLDYFNIEKARFQFEYYKNDSCLVYRKLLLLQLFRVEGTARLIEFLLDNRTQKADTWISEKFHATYWIDYVLRLFVGLVEEPEENEDSSMATSLSYRAGYLLVFNSLYFIDEVNRPVYDAVIEKIYLQQPIFIADFQGINIIENLLNITLEEFIFANLQTKIQSKLCVGLNGHILGILSKLLKLEGFQREEKSVDLLYNIINDVPNEAAHYSSILNRTQEMTDDEIHEFYVFFKSKHLSNPTFIQLLDKVYAEWQQTQDELARWKLTYVFEDNDIFHDELPIIGILDDMLVLNS